MKAIVFRQAGLPLEDPRGLYEETLEKPVPKDRDLLVEVAALSVNPVDTKVRQGGATNGPRVLGWDAVGIVREIGKDVSLFKVGDEVFYAGAIDRPGCYSEFHLVDERMAGRKPRTIDNAHAAALPLTSITAWELLFDRLSIKEGDGEGQYLLIIGAAGGVGSILTQLARKLTKLTIVGTASRPETTAWVKELGAHHVINHNLPLADQLTLPDGHLFNYAVSLTHTDKYLGQIVDLLTPQGKLALIDDPQQLDISLLKRKSLSLHWELMFTRGLYQTPDLIKQHELLDKVAALIDQGIIKTTATAHFGRINAKNLKRAHALIESGRSRGKIVLEGF